MMKDNKDNIETISETEFTVNGKPIYLDHNTKWVAHNLSASEMKTAFNHIRKLD